MNRGNLQYIFSAYSDESGCFTEDYQSIGVVSGKTEELERLKEELSQILAKNRVKEIKFAEVRTHSPKVRAAQEFVDKAIEYVINHSIKIDVLCWWIRDARHDIHGRDDLANLARMYYKVLRNISEKWHALNWMILPDKGSKLNWSEIVGYLNRTRLIRKPYLMTLFQQDNFVLNFKGVMPQDSIDEPLVQLADLFAGMACFSIGKKDLCHAWMRKNHYQRNPGLFCDKPDEKMTKAEYNRFDLLYRIYKQAKKHRLGVSLERKGYIQSFSKTAPLNFWHYQPTNVEDKAPIRSLR
jgi:hypothetical protein